MTLTNLVDNYGLNHLISDLTRVMLVYYIILYYIILYYIILYYIILYYIILYYIILYYIILYYIILYYIVLYCIVLHCSNIVNRTYIVRAACTNSRPSIDTSDGKWGSVGWVAILNSAAIGSKSDHGGLVVSISTTVQPILLKHNR